MLKDKRGVLGLDKAKAVMIWFLVLAVLAIAIIIALTSLRDSVESVDTTSLAIPNESITGLDDAGDDFVYAQSASYRNAVCSGVVVTNTTGTEVVPATNYTLTNNGCTISTSAEGGTYNQTDINVSYSVTYSNPQTNLIAGNVTSALTNDFFDQTGTIFAILIVVVIMFAIGLIIFVVTRFASNGGSIGFGNGSRESGTMMGV